ncbi:unnamed protein product, partial [Mesorhabditis spiculigera]
MHKNGSTSSALSDNQDPSSPRTKVSTTTATSAATSGRSSGNAGQLEERKRSQQLLGPDVFFRKFRQIVSQNRRRYQNDGYDLDLTYITDRIIAMGYPASDRESVYRNSMEQTVSFLERRHRGHYKVFNLRGSYVYDPALFEHRVVCFEMTDHHPPRLELMAPFCREVHNYLQEDKRNIVAVHCKAGKGRTGVMICAYLVYIGFYLSPRQNMDYYSVVRTMNNKGVTIPSQRRYVYYFAHLRKFHLNYIPLRVELVGVYVERPPCISGSLTKGDFSLRVCNGDVDVYHGEWYTYTKESWEDEDKKWGNPTRCSRGPDSYDPCNPVRGNDVISRRAYGWTVPSNKRVFLEGDVRMDLYHSKKVKLLNVGSKDRSKVGHVWWNTMFACPQFCGGFYKHGDEAFPYPPGETTIASRVLSTNPPPPPPPPPPQQGVRPKSGSASVPNSPPLSPKTERSSTATRAPSFDARKNKASSANRLHNAVKKLAEGVVSRNSEPNIDRPSSSGKRDGSSSDPTRRGDGSSFDIHLISPPGQDLHCPTDSLEAIYGDKEWVSIPPRIEIERILREAHLRELVADQYNERRLSVPQDGTPVEKAPDGRPGTSTGFGPFCITREAEEHVQIYNVLEVDRAYKKKDIDPGFRLIVVTRCVPVGGSDAELAKEFMRVTHEKQQAKDEKKFAQIAARQKKLSEKMGESEEAVKRSMINQDNFIDEEQWQHDDRFQDPLQKKYFYRQRIDSFSRYPLGNYRCPLLTQFSTSPPRMTPPAATSPLSANNPRANQDMDVRSYHPDDGQWREKSDISTSSDEESDHDASQATIRPPSNFDDECKNSKPSTSSRDA